jgi:hypothetical protein
MEKRSSIARRTEDTSTEFRASRFSGFSRALSVISRGRSSVSSTGSTYNPNKFDLFANKAPKLRDDTSKELKELLKEEKLSHGDTRLLMEEYIARGEFPPEESRKKLRQAALASVPPRVPAAKRSYADEYAAALVRCQWKGSNDRGWMFRCSNRAIRNPRTREMTRYCGFHQHICLAIHPGGNFPIDIPNEDGLCKTHFASMHQQEPALYSDPWSFPGVIRIMGGGVKNPLAPKSESPPPLMLTDGDDAGSDASSVSSESRSRAPAAAADEDDDDEEGFKLEPDVFDKALLAWNRFRYRRFRSVSAATIRGVTRFQALFRRHLATRVVKRYRHDREVATREAAARMLQRLFRVRQLTIDYPWLQRAHHDAAIKLQRTYRVHRYNLAIKHDRMMALSALKIQRWYRSQQMRRAFVIMRVRMRGRMDGIAKAKSRVILVTVLLRYIARFRRRKRQLYEKKLFRSARMLQNAWRGYIGFKNRHKVRAEIARGLIHRELVNRLQMAYLAYKRRRYGKELRDAMMHKIILCQAIARGMLGRKMANKRRAQLESVWNWLHPSLPKSYYDPLKQLPKYEDMFDLTRFSKPPPSPESLLEKPPASALSLESRLGRLKGKWKETSETTDEGEDKDNDDDHLSSASPRTITTMDVMPKREFVPPSTRAPKLNAHATKRAELENKRLEDEERDAQATIEAMAKLLVQHDLARTGGVTPQAFARCMDAVGFPLHVGRILRKRFHDVETDKILYDKFLRASRELGRGINLRRGPLPTDRMTADDIHIGDPDQGSEFQTLHMPQEDRKRKLAKGFRQQGLDIIASNHHANRESMTEAGRYAFQNHPEWIPLDPRAVPGIKGIEVEETIAVARTGPKEDDVAIVVTSDPTAYDMDAKQPSAATLQAQQDILSSFLAMSTARTAGLMNKAQAELDDPEMALGRPRPSKSFPEHLAKLDIPTLNYTTMQAELGPVEDDTGTGLDSRWYVQTLAGAQQGTKPTTGQGRFAPPKAVLQSSLPSGDPSMEDYRTMTEDIRALRKMQREAFEQVVKRPPSRGRPLPVVGVENGQLVLHHDVESGINRVVLFLAGLVDGEPLQEDPPNRVMKLMLDNMTLLRKHWKAVIHRLRVGGAMALGHSVTHVPPSPHKAALFEALLRHVGIASSVPSAAQSDIGGLSVPAANAARIGHDGTQHFRLPVIQSAPRKLESAPSYRVPREPTVSRVLPSAVLPTDSKRPTWSADPRSISSRAESAVKAATHSMTLSTRTRKSTQNLLWVGESHRTPPYKPPQPITLPSCAMHLWLAPSDHCTQCRAYRSMPLPQPPCVFFSSALVRLNPDDPDSDVSLTCTGIPSPIAVPVWKHKAFMGVLVLSHQQPEMLAASSEASNPTVFFVAPFAFCEDTNGVAWLLGFRLWRRFELEGVSKNLPVTRTMLSRSQVVHGKTLMYLRISDFDIVGTGAAIAAKNETEMRRAAKREKIDLPRCVFFANTFSGADESQLLAADALAQSAIAADDLVAP